MILSFLLSLHAVEFAFGVMILARARGHAPCQREALASGFVRVEGFLYAALVIMHLLLHHQIPNGVVDRFFDMAILSVGALLIVQIFVARRAQTRIVVAHHTDFW